MENYNWLEVFDKEDLIQFLIELLVEIKSYEVDNYSNPFDDLIHEWYESALAINDPEIRKAFNE